MKFPIEVSYRKIAKWHVFESADIDGLYVASPHEDLARNDLIPVIQSLLKLNHGIDISITEDMILIIDK